MLVNVSSLFRSHVLFGVFCDGMFSVHCLGLRRLNEEHDQLELYFNRIKRGAFLLMMLWIEAAFC